MHSVPTRGEQLRTAVEIVAIVAAGIWALYTFVYEQRIKPLAQAPSFSLPTLVDQQRAPNGAVFLTIHKRLENTGDVSIDIAAESLSVYGEQFTSVRRVRRLETPTLMQVSEDVPRTRVALLFSIAKLRSGAVGGNPTTSFFLPAHSSAEEDYVVVVPPRTYPMVLITRKDYVEKAPIEPKIPVRIVRDRYGAYDLQPTSIAGEYDNREEYPIR